MRSYTITFNFDGTDYSADVQEEIKPGDLEFYIKPKDESIKNNFGNSFVVHWDHYKKQYIFSLKTFPNRYTFRVAVIKALRHYRETQ
jgi:hypothetical protein